MPFIPRAIEEIARTIQPVVHERRMLWGDMEQALRVGGNREGIMLPDGIHMNDEGHRRIAAMVVPVALEVAATLSVDRPIAVESVESRS
jgi:lysophospholipase L1-like esterase